MRDKQDHNSEYCAGAADAFAVVTGALSQVGHPWTDMVHELSVTYFERACALAWKEEEHSCN